MMRHFLFALISGTLLSTGIAGPVAAQTAAEINKTFDELFGSHLPYQEFFDKLQKAIDAGDKQSVASMVDYPFRARIGGKAVKINDAVHFVAAYDKIMTTHVKQAILKQTYPTLFANWQGVSIGDGEVWFSGTGKSNIVKITAIND